MDFKQFLQEGIPQRHSLDPRLDYATRIAQGRGLESEIKDRIKTEWGWDILPSTPNEDKHLGIDGWINDPTQGRVPVQIKARTSGSDILWEAIKPWSYDLTPGLQDKNYTGKDMKCQARLLISVSNDGTMIRLRKIDEIKQKAKLITEAFVSKFGEDRILTVSTPWGEGKLVRDPSAQANFSMGNVLKLNCFILPEVLAWKKDVRLKTPILAN